MIKCISHKKVFPTQEIAEDALLEARIHFDYPAGKGPIAVYRCEDCGYYHLTSSGTMNQKLSEYMAKGEFKREKEASRWKEKFRNK